MPTSFDLNFQTFFIHSSLTFISFYFFTYTDFCLQTSSYGLLGRLYQSRNYRPWFGNVIEHVTYRMDVQSQFLITNLFFCTMLLDIFFFQTVVSQLSNFDVCYGNLVRKDVFWGSYWCPNIIICVCDKSLSFRKGLVKP